MLANDSYIKDSVTFKVYIDDSLVVSFQRGNQALLLPYEEQFGVKTGLGKHKITVVIDDGFMQRDFNVCVCPVRYCIIYFCDKYNDETGVFEGFEVGINTYSVLLPFLRPLIG
jgi:hypothetical protein